MKMLISEASKNQDELKYIVNITSEINNFIELHNEKLKILSPKNGTALKEFFQLAKNIKTDHEMIGLSESKAPKFCFDEYFYETLVKTKRDLNDCFRELKKVPEKHFRDALAPTPEELKKAMSTFFKQFELPPLPRGTSESIEDMKNNFRIVAKFALIITEKLQNSQWKDYIHHIQNLVRFSEAVAGNECVLKFETMEGTVLESYSDIKTFVCELYLKINILIQSLKTANCSITLITQLRFEDSVAVYLYSSRG